MMWGAKVLGRSPSANWSFKTLRFRWVLELPGLDELGFYCLLTTLCPSGSTHADCLCHTMQCGCSEAQQNGKKKKKKRILWLYGGDCDEGQVTRMLLREQGSI